MKLIFAIGNPGIKYKFNYHNLGLLFADFLINKHNVISEKIETNFHLFKFEEFSLLKSKVFMNLSYQALGPIYNFYKIEKLLVVHDDLTLKKHEIKLKHTQGNSGHNGLKDIANHIKEFDRLRIGIDHPKNFNPEMATDSYVLSNIDDLSQWQECFEKGLIETQKWINIKL